MLKPFEFKIKEIESKIKELEEGIIKEGKEKGKIKKLIFALRELTETDIQLAATILKKHRIL